MAQHYCSICRLWDDEEQRAIYHCPFCNLCRVGKGLGVDACHCMRCNACMHLTEFDKHKCRDLSTCPVCTEYLFDSNQPYRVSRCPFCWPAVSGAAVTLWRIWHADPAARCNMYRLASWRADNEHFVESRAADGFWLLRDNVAC